MFKTNVYNHFKVCDNAQTTSTNKNVKQHDQETGQQNQSTKTIDDNNTKHVVQENDERTDLNPNANANETKINDEHDVPNIITTAPSATDLDINSDFFEKAKVL